MATFSMDLGIDTSATGGASGVPQSPYPLQITLSTGTLGEEGYVPTGLASWRAIKSTDLFLVRVFDITLAPGILERVVWASCTAYGPEWMPRHLFTESTLVKSPTDQPAPGFALPTIPDLPCWILRLGSSIADPIQTFPIELVPAPTTYLLSVMVAGSLISGPGESTAKIYQTDPEMVVSPDLG